MTARRPTRPTRSPLALAPALLLASALSLVPGSSALAAEARSIDAGRPASGRAAGAPRLQAAPVLPHPPASPLVCHVAAPTERRAVVSLSEVPWPAPASEASAARPAPEVALVTVPAGPDPGALTLPDLRERLETPALDPRPWPRPDPVHPEWWRTAAALVDAAGRRGACPTG